MTSLTKSLLPTGQGEFAKKEYWESFFKKRGSKAFEWYGEYTDLVGVLSRYVKQKERIFMVGCGNSDLSVDLYDIHQCHDIVNLDISSVVIRQMQDKHCSKGKRPGLRYVLGDICNLDREKLLATDCADKSQSRSLFTCVIDKGTLDAMYSEGEESLSKVEAMFREIEDVLRISGRYICITLAQEHIVKALMNYFTEKSPFWLIRVHKLARDSASKDSTEFPLPVFVFVFTKFTATDKFRPIFEVQQELTNEKMIRLQFRQDVTDWVSLQQTVALVINSLSEQRETRCSFKCASTNQIYCVCQIIQNPKPISNEDGGGKKRGKKKPPKSRPDDEAPVLPYAVFIAPLGSHDYPMFLTESTRQELCVSARTERLFLVLLNPRVYYKSREQIQDSLDSIAMQFSPPGLDTSSIKIPYMTCGSTTYPLDELQTGNLPSMGPYLVEEGSTLGRLLIFPESNFQQVQLTNQPNCVRDEYLQTLITCIADTMPQTGSLTFCGLPKFTDALKNKNVSCYLGEKLMNSEETETVQALFDKYFNPNSITVEFSISSTGQRENQCDFLIYDPISVDQADYSKKFQESSLTTWLSSLSNKSVVLLMIDYNEDIEKKTIKECFSNCGLSIFLEKTVKDEWLGDQDSCCCDVIIACSIEYRSEFVPQLIDYMDQVKENPWLQCKTVADLKTSFSK